MLYDNNTILLVFSIFLQVVLVFERVFTRIRKSSCSNCCEFELFSPNGRRNEH